MNIESTHLDIEDLLPKASGVSLSEQAKAHLAACSACRRDAERWETIARSVRRLVAATPAPASYLPDDAEIGPSGAQERSGRRDKRPTKSRRLPRRAYLGGAAAAVLGIAAASYGLAAGLSGPGTRPATSGGSRTVSAGLTAVNGCSALDATSGTLEQVNGPNLVIKTSNGQSVTVSTSASTKTSREVSGSLDDIQDGVQVLVETTESNGTTVAQSVGVGIAGVLDKLKQPIPPVLPVKVAGTGIGPQLGLANGTVADATVGAFTVVEPDGTRVPVTTTSSTTVTVLAGASVTDLNTGEFTVAVGTSGTSGALQAESVEQEAVSSSVLPAGRLRLPGIGQAGGMVGLPNVGCSAQTVATARLLAAG